MVLDGGVAGAEPLHKGGPKARPPRTAVVSDQWSVVSGQRLWRLIQGWHWLSSYELCKKHIQHSFDREQKQEDRQIDGRDQEESAGQQLYRTEEEV